MPSNGIHEDGGSGASSPTGFTTASITPVSDSLYLMTITIARGSSLQPTAPTVPGFTQQGSTIDYDTAGSTRASKFLFRAIGSNLSVGTIAVTFGYTAQNYAYELDQIPSVDTSGTNGSGAIVQHVQNNGSSNNPNATLAAFASANNGTYGSSGAQALPHSTTPQGTGFTLLGQHSNTGATVTVSSISEYRDDNDTSVDTNLNSSGVWGLDAIEVKIVATDTITVNQASETDTAQPVTVSPLSAIVNQAVETDTAQLVTPVTPGIIAVGQALETDTAQVVTPMQPLTIMVGQAIETDRALPIRDGTVAVAPAAITIYDTQDLINAVAEVTPTAVSWEEQLSEAGSGEITIQNDLPQPTKGQVLTLSIQGEPRWSMLCETFTRIAVAQGGRAQNRTTWRGRGLMADWRKALTFPALGLPSKPKQTDWVADYTLPGYNAWWWTPPNWFDNGNLVFNWGTDIGAWAADFPDPDALGLTPPLNSDTDAPEGPWYGREWVYFPGDDDYRLAAGGDNTFTGYLSGAQVIDLQNHDNFGRTNEVQVTIRGGAGWRLFAWECDNKPWVTGDNPTAARWSWMTMQGQVIGHSDTSAVVVGPYELGFPAETDGPPGMTVGNAIRLWLEAAQARGCLPGWRLGFNDLVDSALVQWGPVYPNGIDYGPRVSTKILNDGYSFLREIAGTYADLRAAPNERILYAWNKDTMNDVDSGLLFLPSNYDTRLEQAGQDTIGTVIIANFNDQYHEREDTAATAARGERIETEFQLGAANDDDEVERILAANLPNVVDPPDELTVNVDGPIPYVDYDLAQRAQTLDSDDNVAERRIVAQAVKWAESTGRIVGTPTLGGLFL